jgi:hypothetical protein
VLLVDTSAWIEVFRKPARLRLDDVGGLDQVVTCLPVIQEVLQGFRLESAYRVAKEAMLALPCVEVTMPGRGSRRRPTCALRKRRIDECGRAWTASSRPAPSTTG